MFKNIYYKILVWSLYKIGDILCNLDYEWSWHLYQKTMTLSYEYDKHLDFWLWKEPTLDKQNDL